MNTAVYEETPEEIVLKPRIRAYRKRAREAVFVIMGQRKPEYVSRC